MPLRCQLGKPWEPQGHNIARVCLRDARLGSFWITQGHDVARLCHPDTRLGNFWESQGMILPEYASKMLGWKIFGKTKPIVLSEHASICQAGQLLRNSRPECIRTRMCLRDARLELNAISLPEHAPEMPASETFRKLKAESRPYLCQSMPSRR